MVDNSCFVFQVAVGLQGYVSVSASPWSDLPRSGGLLTCWYQVRAVQSVLGGLVTLHSVKLCIIWVSWLFFKTYKYSGSWPGFLLRTVATVHVHTCFAGNSSLGPACTSSWSAFLKWWWRNHHQNGFIYLFIFTDEPLHISSVSPGCPSLRPSAV